MFCIPALLLSLAAYASAAPSLKRQDNGSCQALQNTCVNEVRTDLNNVWSVKACVMGATCFGGQRPVDGFLSAVHSATGGAGSAPTGLTAPRMPAAVCIVQT
jgi:hypothetical protein